MDKKPIIELSVVVFITVIQYDDEKRIKKNCCSTKKGRQELR